MEPEVKVKHHFVDMNKRPVSGAQADTAGLEVFTRALKKHLAQSTRSRQGWHVKDTATLEGLETKLKDQLGREELDPLEIASCAMTVFVRRLMAQEQARDVEKTRG